MGVGAAVATRRRLGLGANNQPDPPCCIAGIYPVMVAACGLLAFGGGGISMAVGFWRYSWLA